MIALHTINIHTLVTPATTQRQATAACARRRSFITD
jgi:hypothetical protein